MHDGMHLFHWNLLYGENKIIICTWYRCGYFKLWNLIFKSKLNLCNRYNMTEVD